jgi:YbaB/EbfC DNA-binding family
MGHPGDVNWQSRIVENAARYQDLHQRVSRLSVSEVSPDGAVRVTVSATGLMTGLEVSESARFGSNAELADAVMSCLRRAQARLPDLVGQAVSESMGATEETGQLLVDEARRRFPEPPPSTTPSWQPEEFRVGAPEAPPRPRPTRRRETGDEDWGEERTVLHDV